MSRSGVARTTVRDALDSAVIALTAAGCDTPRLDAQVLLAHVLGIDRAALFLGPGRGLEPEEAARFREAVARRRDREPVAYITGVKGFRNLDLAVDARVRVPRPETEHLVEAARALPEGARVVDVGTGSGAVALALADERPDLEIAGADVSPDALEVARANGRRLGLAVDWVQADGLPPGAWDAVVANLPYVETSASLAPEIAKHEPALAVYSGEDGLDVIRRVIDQAAAGRVPWVAFEHGSEQGTDVRLALSLAGWPDVRTERDLAGLERVTVGC
jgi:release factor glutamine methyltransferase